MATETPPATPGSELEDNSGFNTMASLLAKNMSEVIAEPTTDTPAPKIAAAKVEPPKQEDKPEEVKTAVPAKPVEEEIPKGLSVKASEHFTTLRKSRDELRGKLEALEAGELAQLRAENKKLKETPASALDNTELETLKKERENLARERDELSRIVQVKDVENHPKFKAYFGQKLADATAIAQSIAGPELSDQVGKVLKMTDGTAKDSALEEIVGQMPPMRANQFMASLVELQKIQHERSGELSKASEHWKTLEAEKLQQHQQQQEQTKAEIAQAMKVAETAMSKFDGFKEVEGDANHNSEVASRKQFVKDFFNGAVKKEFIPMMPLMIGEYLHQKNSVIPGYTQKIATLEKQLQELQAAAPSLDSTGKPVAVVPDNQPAPGEGFKETYRRLVSGG